MIHTFVQPWPLKVAAKYGQLGGTWIYPMKDEKTGDDLVSIGFVVDLNYRDATTSAHDLLQAFKTAPAGQAGSSRAASASPGAPRRCPGGGYWSMPKLSMPGAVLVGDAGGMVDTAALKGVHHCIKSGMLAAEAIYAPLKTRRSASRPTRRRSSESSIGKELYQVRNTRQAFQKGFVVGQPARGPSIMSKGKVPPGRQEWHRDDAEPMFVGDTQGPLSQARRQVHLRQALARCTSRATRPATTRPTTSACSKNVPREIAETWRWMCPAGVYEIPDDAPEEGPST